MRAIELTGFRIGDLRGVIGATRDERPCKIKVRRAKKKDRLGNPIWEEIAIPETARKALCDYLSTLGPADKEPHARVFPISVRRAEGIFKYYAKRAGLSATYSIHSLRHTRGLMLAEQFRDPKLIQEALGHANLSTTARYLHTLDLDRKLAEADLKEEESGKEDEDEDEA